MRVKSTGIAIILSIFFLAITSAMKTEYQPAQAFPVWIEDYVKAAPLPTKITFEKLSPQKQKEARCLAQNIYFEARSEPLEGRLAVAHVTLNRVESDVFPSTVCDVVRQKTRNICQFSWWCDTQLKLKALNNRVEDELYNEIKQLAVTLLVNSDKRRDNTGGALFYHARYVSKHALGMPKLIPTVTVGQHVFYRMPI